MSNDLRLVARGEKDLTEVWDQLEDVSDEFASVPRRKDRQLNLRVDDDLLAALREAAGRSGEGYHTFARRLIEEGVARALAEPGSESEQGRLPRPLRMKEVLLVLLASGQATREPPEAIAGRTRLQKLLFLAAQHLQPHVAARFEAYSFGPFEESVESDVEFLATEGLIEATGHEALPEVREHDPDRGRRVLEWVRTRHDESAEPTVEQYRLTREGLDWVQRFLESEEYGDPDVKSRLVAESAALRKRFGRVSLEDLVDFVYTEYPQFATRSKIRHKVAERVARKSER